MSQHEDQIPDKPFSALTGDEIREIVLKQISEKMESDTSFAPHLTYPVVEWEWTLSLRSYPARDDKGIHLQTEGRAESTGTLPPLAEDPLTSELTEGHKTDVPDETREEFGIPVTTPARNPQGRFVDRAEEKPEENLERPATKIPGVDD